MATAPSKLWTIDDLIELPDDRRVEIHRGALIDMSPSSLAHSIYALRIGSKLLEFVERGELGVVSGSDGGYVLGRNPDILYAPDVAFVPAERVPDNLDRFAEVVPDLVVEVISPTDRVRDLSEKVGVYLTAGVRLVWVVEPASKSVQVHQRGVTGTIGVRREGDELDGGEVLPGFRLPVAEIFR